MTNIPKSDDVSNTPDAARWPSHDERGYTLWYRVEQYADTGAPYAATWPPFEPQIKFKGELYPRTADPAKVA
jgi:hypothetical protein